MRCVRYGPYVRPLPRPVVILLRLLGSVQAEEKARRDALTASLKSDAQSRVTALQDELRAMEMSVSDLNHQLQRAHREGARSSRRNASGAMGGGGLGGGLGPVFSDAMLPISSLMASDAAGRAARLEGTRAMDELASRLGTAERERDSAEQQRRALTLQLRVQGETHSQERAASGAREEKLQRQARRYMRYVTVA